MIRSAVMRLVVDIWATPAKQRKEPRRRSMSPCRRRRRKWRRAVRGRRVRRPARRFGNSANRALSLILKPAHASRVVVLSVPPPLARLPTRRTGHLVRACRHHARRRPSLALLLGAGQRAAEPRRSAGHPRRRPQHVRHPRDGQLQAVAGGASASDVDAAAAHPPPWAGRLGHQPDRERGRHLLGHRARAPRDRRPARRQPASLLKGSRGAALTRA
eukprot:scaffold92795_cov48-Phaeocystis_antarctica.AAC.2